MSPFYINQALFDEVLIIPRLIFNSRQAVWICSLLYVKVLSVFWFALSSFFLYLKGNISNMCLFVPMWTVQLFQQTTLLQSLSWRRRALLLWQLMKNWTLWCLRVPRRPEACGWKSVPQPDMGVLLAVDSTDLEWKRAVWVTWQSFNKLLTNEAECSPWEIT